MDIEKLKKQIHTWIGKEVDIIDHPHSTYRMVKHGKAKITQAYDNFFEVMIDTKEYGSYRTTITYIDLYTGSCFIQLHQESE